MSKVFRITPKRTKRSSDQGVLIKGSVLLITKTLNAIAMDRIPIYM